MACAVVREGTNSTDREMYCHRCKRFFWRSENERTECPICHEGFTEGYNGDGDNAGTSSYSFPHDELQEVERLTGNLSRRPMTDAQLQEIPKATITEEQTTTQCAVCLEFLKLDENEIRQLHCSHLFHENCIFPWVRENKRCPLCRSILPNANYAEDEDEDYVPHSGVFASQAFLEYRRLFLVNRYGFEGYLDYVRQIRAINSRGRLYADSISSGEDISDISEISDIADISDIAEVSDYSHLSDDSFDTSAFEKLGPIDSDSHNSYSIIPQPAQVKRVQEDSFYDPEFEQFDHQRPSTSGAASDLKYADDSSYDTSDSSDNEIGRSRDLFRYRRLQNSTFEQIDNERPSTSAASFITQRSPEALEQLGSPSSCDDRCRAAEKTRSTQTVDTTNEITLLNRPPRMRLWNSHRAPIVAPIDATEIIEISSSSDDDDVLIFEGTPPKRRNIDDSDSSSM